MGIEIDRETFEDADYVAFDARLRENLVALAEVMRRPEFGAGPLSLGAELELDLIDEQGRAFPKNRELLRRIDDPRVTLEIDRFNLEINASPVPFAGAPLTAIGAELEEILAIIGRVAERDRARVLTVGILPTLAAGDLHADALTDRLRYRAMSAGLRRLRNQVPVPIRIEGADRLELECEDAAMEGANTSLQIHLRVAREQFAAMHNAAQIATAPVLAVSGNSPLFLGKRLWEETRIALFQQTVDDRPLDDPYRSSRLCRVSFGHGWVRTGAFELFAESVALHAPLLPLTGPEDPIAVARAGRVPSLFELRLHHGTVWRWNRAVYDATADGHLRIEFRALPSGPTMRDMMANAAFMLGVTLAIEPEVERWLPGLTFGQARGNFYAAARHGLGAVLLWPPAPGERVEPIGARELAERLVPVARRGLIANGFDPAEADRHLDIIGRRLASGQTGAVWQRRVFDAARARTDVADACRVVALAYRDASASGVPVHDWGMP